MNLPTVEPEEGSLKSIYDEWLIMKLWCMSFPYAGWSDTLQIIPLKIDNAVDNVVFRISKGAFYCLDTSPSWFICV